MPTRNVVLTDHQEALIGALVESGRYQNASEVLREGLRLVEQRELEDQARLEALRAALDEGLTDLAEGRYRAFERVEDVMAHLLREDANPTGDAPPTARGT
jgi:antitoxin ParD1/3/4